MIRKTRTLKICIDKRKYPFFLLAGIYFFSCITGILNYTITSSIVTLLLVFLVQYNEYYLAFPIILLYYSVLLIPGANLSVFVFYLLLMGIKLIILGKGQFEANRRNVICFIVVLVYSCTVFLVYDVKLAIPFIISSVVMFFYTKKYLYYSENLKRFLKFYVIACICSFMTGIFTNNIMVYDALTIDKVLNLRRWMATFNDPNYMGLFFMVAIFAILCYELFPKVIRYALVIALCCMILSTMSVTAILGGMIVFIIYLLLKNKIRLKSVIYLILLFIVLGGIYNYGVNNPKTPLIGTVSQRIEEKIELTQMGDVSKASTGRLDLSEEHMSYFENQKLGEKMVGGNIINAIAIEPKRELRYAVAHNEYVDLLLNVGLIGAILMIGSWIITLGKDLIIYWKCNQNKELFLVITRLIFLYYCFGLTMFMDIRFFLFYIL